MQGFQKVSCRAPFYLKVSIWSLPAVVRKQSLARLCFFLNHNDYCAVGTYLLSKHRFWTKVSALILKCLVVSCCSYSFNRLLHNTTVNAEPLKPSIFEKVGLHLNKCVCSDLLMANKPNKPTTSPDESQKKKR